MGAVFEQQIGGVYTLLFSVVNENLNNSDQSEENESIIITTRAEVHEPANRPEVVQVEQEMNRTMTQVVTPEANNLSEHDVISNMNSDVITNVTGQRIRKKKFIPSILKRGQKVSTSQPTECPRQNDKQVCFSQRNITM